MQYAGNNTQGLGTTFLNVKNQHVAICQLFSFLVLLLFLRRVGVVCFIVNVAVTFLYRKLVLSKVGGFNGDTLGACSPISQVVFLLTLVVMRGTL